MPIESSGIFLKGFSKETGYFFTGVEHTAAPDSAAWNQAAFEDRGLETDHGEGCLATRQEGPAPTMATTRSRLLISFY